MLIRRLKESIPFYVNLFGNDKMLKCSHCSCCVKILHIVYSLTAQNENPVLLDLLRKWMNYFLVRYFKLLSCFEKEVP